VLTLYKVALMPFMVLLSCALLQPAQLAAFYVQSWWAGHGPQTGVVNNGAAAGNTGAR
jgi:hypothetical protein